jgi:hypothetical protein
MAVMPMRQDNTYPVHVMTAQQEKATAETCAYMQCLCSQCIWSARLSLYICPQAYLCTCQVPSRPACWCTPRTTHVGCRWRCHSPGCCHQAQGTAP